MIYLILDTFFGSLMLLYATVEFNNFINFSPIRIYKRVLVSSHSPASNFVKRGIRILFTGIIVFGLTPFTPSRASAPAQPTDGSTLNQSQLQTQVQTGETPNINQPVASSLASPTIRDVITNASDYPNGQVPKYEKFEITFQVDTVAQNLQLPFDPNPPGGVEAGIGISVDALFSPDNWQTVFTQPAFYYQEFQDEIKSGREWYYPTGRFSWKVRFAPTDTGSWQYKLVAQDADGTTETSPQTFTVVQSNNRGFIKVSQKDARYFEYDDGTYFPGMGINMNYSHVSWSNPVLDNEENFQIMSENGLQLVRLWLSQWGIYGPSWNPWNSIDPNQHAQYIPQASLTSQEAYSSSEISMRISATWIPCMFIGVFKAKPAVKRNTDYRIRIRYKTTGISSPRDAGSPYGFVAKTGGWLWGEGQYCDDTGTGTPVTPYQDQNTSDWQMLEGALNTGNSDYLQNFYLVMENVDQGVAFIDYVWIEEDLGDGSYGSNIVSKPWMAHHLYMEQRNSYAFDKLLDLANQYGVYLRPVIHEKNEYIFNRIDFEGDFFQYDSTCWDSDPNNNPEKCPGNKWFYGNWRQVTKVRWLQQAWWRYLQARWGYSPNIHSWELLNEGDPWNGTHYTLADEFGKYMRQFNPNDHLVSTSFWHSFPKDNFWANSNYPNIDFADVHKYIGESASNFDDAALATYELSMQYGAEQSGGAGKPLIRGETGFVVSGSGPATYQFENDTGAVWLHNFVWGGINAGGMIESYWYETTHIYDKRGDGSYNFDYRSTYSTFYNFIKDIPLNNGNYEDAEAMVSNDDLRAWGQKDLVNDRAYLWIQNKTHTWVNVVNGVSITDTSGTVTITGFKPDQSYTVQWWDPYQTDSIKQIVRTETTTAQADGSLIIGIENLATDTALKISPTNYEQPCFSLSVSHTGQGSDPAAAPANTTGCSTGQYHNGEEILLTAVVDTGWQVSSWENTSDDASHYTTNTLIMPASDHTVSVSYISQPGFSVYIPLISLQSE